MRTRSPLKLFMLYLCSHSANSKQEHRNLCQQHTDSHGKQVEPYPACHNQRRKYKHKADNRSRVQQLLTTLRIRCGRAVNAPGQQQRTQHHHQHTESNSRCKPDIKEQKSGRNPDQSCARLPQQRRPNPE